MVPRYCLISDRSIRQGREKAGIILRIVSDVPMIAVSYIFSVLLIISGLVLVMYYIGREVTPENESYDLVAGIVAVDVGVYVLIHAKLLTPWMLKRQAICFG